MFKKILLAYDGSEGARFALEKVVALAKLADAELHLLAVGRIPEYAETVSETEEAKEQAKGYYSKIMDDAVTHLKQQGLAAKIHIEFGKPADTILRTAEALSTDLLVLGTHPHSAVRRRVLGATVDKVIDHAHCSVLVVRN
ncbi:MAG TPA: universal stress protein [Candidatus Acidoferrales bacterium]|nr:universal stress protein [Candidatus Acidoferrales bacterium]